MFPIFRSAADADADDVSVIQPKYISRLARPGHDSDVESETELTDDEDDDDEEDDEEVGDGGFVDPEQESSNAQSWLSWCSVL